MNAVTNTLRHSAPVFLSVVLISDGEEGREEGGREGEIGERRGERRRNMGEEGGEKEK